MKETAFIHFLCLLIPLIIFPVSIFILQQKYKESFPNAIYKACLMFFLLPISFYLYIHSKKLYILKSKYVDNFYFCICLPIFTKKSSPKFHDFIIDILNFIKLLHKLINNPLSFIFSLFERIFERINELFERIKRKENVFLEVFTSLLLFISLLFFSMFIIFSAFYMVS